MRGHCGCNGRMTAMPFAFDEVVPNPNSRQEGPRIVPGAGGYQDSGPLARRAGALVKPSLIFDSRGEGMSKGAAEHGKAQTLYREAQGGLTTHAEVDRSNQNAILAVRSSLP